MIAIPIEKEKGNLARLDPFSRSKCEFFQFYGAVTFVRCSSTTESAKEHCISNVPHEFASLGSKPLRSGEHATCGHDGLTIMPHE